MLAQIGVFFTTYYNFFNDWLYLKSMQLNDWIVSTRFSSRWSVLTRIVTGFVGFSSMLWARKLFTYSNHKN